MKIIPTVLSLLQRTSQVQGPFKKNIKSFSTGLVNREFEEIQFSVPWGHVAGKWYGPKDKRPIVGLHGWQDNAGTFDTLAPLLPPHIGFLSIDLPGHGKSSWLPNGCSYHSIDNIKTIFSLMREFKWQKISMICHSMSAVDGFELASYFPDKCDLFVALDIVQPLLGKKEMSVQLMIQQFEEYNKQMEISLKQLEPPSYTMSELIELLQRANGRSISSRENCELVLKRNIKPSKVDPDKFYFCRDGRLKSMMFSLYPHNVLVEIAQRIKCPHLFLRAKRAKHYDSVLELEDIMNAFKKNPAFEYHLVDGTHYVHLNEPQKTADILNPFINKYRPE